MRTGLFSVMVAGLIAVSPVLADIGTVTLLVSSTHDNSTLDLNPTVGVIQYSSAPATIPVTIKFKATTSGQDGQNSGVYAFFANLTGTALGVQTKTMTQNATFKKDLGTSDGYGAWSGPAGVGFNGLVDLGSPGPGNISGFGASQTTTPGSEDFGNLDAQYAGHPVGSHTSVPLNSRSGVAAPLLASTEAFAGALAAAGDGVTAFTGSITPVALVLDQLYTIAVSGSSSLWNLGGGSVASASTAGSSIQVGVVVPEPTSLLLLAPVALLGFRRRIG